MILHTVQNSMCLAQAAGPKARFGVFFGESPELSPEDSGNILAGFAYRRRLGCNGQTRGSAGSGFEAVATLERASKRGGHPFLAPPPPRNHAPGEG